MEAEGRWRRGHTQYRLPKGYRLWEARFGGRTLYAAGLAPRPPEGTRLQETMRQACRAAFEDQTLWVQLRAAEAAAARENWDPSWKAALQRARRDPAWRAAVHEAGHAVTSVDVGLPFKAVTIIQDGDSLGRVITHKMTESRVKARYWSFALLARNYNGRERRWFEQCVATYLAGGQSERLFTRGPDRGPSRTDILGADDALGAVAGYWGAVRTAYTGWLCAVTKNRVRDLRDEILSVAEALVRFRHMSSRRVRRIVRHVQEGSNKACTAWVEAQMVLAREAIG